MKFLCPSCKAKYQIADEKVAGRSVRMKCRKCGFMIQVSRSMAQPAGGSEAPDADPSEPLVAAPAASERELEAVLASAPMPAAAAKAPPPPSSVGKPPPPSTLAKPPEKPSSALQDKPAKPEKPERPGTPAPARPPSSSATASPAAPRSALSAPRPPPAKLAPSATSKLGAGPPRPGVKATPGSSPIASTAKGVTPAAPSVGASPVAPVVATGPAAVTASAPAAAVATAVPEASPQVAPASQQLPLIRSEFDEDERTLIADTGALAGAFSLALGNTGEHATEPAETTLAMPGDEWFVGINGVPVGPIRLSELRSKAASGAVDKESLVWRDGFEDWRPLKTYPELLAIVEEGVSSARASLLPFVPGGAYADPLAPKASQVSHEAFASPQANGQVTGSAVVTDDLQALGLPKRGGSSHGAWIAVVVALLFGLTIGFVLFANQRPTERIVEKIVEVPAKAVEKTDAPVAANNQLDETNIAEDPKALKKPGAAGTKASAAPVDSKGTATNGGLKSLSGLSGLGPSGGPAVGGPSSTTGGGGQLDSSQVQTTVSRYTGSVKRRCWQPALDTRDKDAPTTAKVTITITVGGSGSVQNATTSGDPRGYRGLANCIASGVRAWQFPASGGVTTVNVPFVFAAQ